MSFVQPIQEEMPMSTHPATGVGTPAAGRGAESTRRAGRVSRLSTETKAAPKTTEFMAYIIVLAGVLIAGLVVDNADGSGSLGADKVWLYATILTAGYMISRGLAKSGSREPYDADRDRHS
jgi:hypothetical protein